MPALTADQALSEVLHVPSGAGVFVHGAGGVTGGLVVQLATLRGATVLATAGPGSAARVRGYGATAVFDYRDPDWPAHVRAASPSGRGVTAAVNTVRGGAAAVIEVVADGGHLATITGDPPQSERGVEVANVYVRADGARLACLAEALAEGMLSLHLGVTVPLTGAAAALNAVSAGRASGATALTVSLDA